MKTEYLLRREVDNVLSGLTPRNALVMRVALHTGQWVGDVLALRSDQIKPPFLADRKLNGEAPSGRFTRAAAFRPTAAGRENMGL